MFDSNATELTINQNVEKLNIGELKSLEKKEFYVYASLNLSDWLKIKSQFSSKQTTTNQNLFKISTSKYPMIERMGERVEWGLYVDDIQGSNVLQMAIYISFIISALIALGVYCYVR